MNLYSQIIMFESNVEYEDVIIFYDMLTLYNVHFV